MAGNDIHGYCEKCNERFIINPRTFDLKKCFECGGHIIWTNLLVEEWFLIDHSSPNDKELLESMMRLKESNPAGFQNRIKLMYRKAVYDGCYGTPQRTVSAIPYIEPPIVQSTPNRPVCPKCGGTHISTGARGVSGFWGFIGANTTVNRCGNCGYTWKPRG